MFKKMLSVLVKSVFAGGMISLGGWLYLRTGDKVLGAFLFSIGLILIVNFGFNLYTGKICYLFDNLTKKEKELPYWLLLIIILVGNYLGCLALGLIFKGVFPEISMDILVHSKLDQTWYEVIVRAIFCGLLINFAVEGFNKITNNFGKYVVLVLCVAGFIIAGFEHCIADMFYLCYAGEFSLASFGFLGLVVVGNTIGGWIFPLSQKLWCYLENDNDN